MGVVRNKNDISMSQRKYALDLLKKTEMLKCKPCETPMDSNQKLGAVDKGDPIDKGSFQRLVGKLIYPSHTQPDVAFVINTINQYAFTS